MKENKKTRKKPKTLKELYPEIVKIWDYNANKNIDIDKIFAYSNVKIDLICINRPEYKWRTTAQNIVRHGNNACPLNYRK